MKRNIEVWDYAGYILEQTGKAVSTLMARQQKSEGLS